MEISEKARNSLREFGLTDYEVRAYVALLEGGPRTASELSKTAEVPFSKVYEVLGSLEKKGWAEAEHGRPTRYYPKPPSDAVEGTKLRMERSLKNNESQILSELQPLYEKKDVHERPDIWIVRGEFNVLGKVREIFNNSTEELLVAVPGLDQTLVEMFTPFLTRLKQVGVKTMIMTTRDQNRSLVKGLGRVAEVRVRRQLFGGGVISDVKEVMILLGSESGEGVGLAIWSDHVGLAKFAKNYFEYLWNEATKIRP